MRKYMKTRDCQFIKYRVDKHNNKLDEWFEEDT